MDAQLEDDSPQHSFDYPTAFSRNIGWISIEERDRLRTKRVAIAGLGGVGGLHFLTLARLGIERFNVAEFDNFELANFNRQAGSSVSHLGKAKIDVVSAMVKDINPSAEIIKFGEGVKPSNIETFLKDVDVYVDGLDFFAFEPRSTTFGACARLGIPAVTAAPLGMGIALLNFLPNRMTFEDYFGFKDQSDEEKALRFLIGLSPAMLQRTYLVDRLSVDFSKGRGPSTVMACHLCAGVAATETLKILLDRGPILSAPSGLHFDAYRGVLKRTWRPGGWRNPLSRIACRMARRQLQAARRAAP